MKSIPCSVVHCPYLKTEADALHTLTVSSEMVKRNMRILHKRDGGLPFSKVLLSEGCSEILRTLTKVNI